MKHKENTLVMLDKLYQKYIKSSSYLSSSYNTYVSHSDKLYTATCDIAIQWLQEKAEILLAGEEKRRANCPVKQKQRKGGNKASARGAWLVNSVIHDVFIIVSL